MSEPKFTPGPWKFEHMRKGLIAIECGSDKLTDERRTEIVAEINDPVGYVPLEERKANAALIAAAPELIEVVRLGYALSKYAASIKWHTAATNTAEWLEGLREKLEEFQPLAEAAIDKAQGSKSL